jgi:hypothetical protein
VDWEGENLPFLFLKILIVLISFFLISCSTPNVEVGKVTVVIKDVIKNASKGEAY